MTAAPSVDQFKTWAKDCAPAARAVLMARVFADMEKERVNAYIRPIFDRYKFTLDPRWNDAGYTIRGPEHLYLCDLDSVEVANFYAECDEAHIAHGWKGKAGHCPALTAQTLVNTTERLLIELAESLCGIKNEQLYGDDRAKYLELLLSSCLGRMEP